MDDVAGIAGALVLIVLGMAFVIAVAQRRCRAIKAAGYSESETQNQIVGQLTEALLALSPKETYRKEEGVGESWLVFVDTRDTERPDLALIVYRLNHDHWPSMVIIQSGRRIPKFLHCLEGGMLKWAEPVPDSELTGITGTGWFAYRETAREVPSAIKQFFAAAVQIPRSNRLFGIAVIGTHLVVWTDAWRLRSLLAAAPAVHRCFRRPPAEPADLASARHRPRWSL